MMMSFVLSLWIAVSLAAVTSQTQTTVNKEASLGLVVAGRPLDVFVDDTSLTVTVVHKAPIQPPKIELEGKQETYFIAISKKLAVLLASQYVTVESTSNHLVQTLIFVARRLVADLELIMNLLDKLTPDPELRELDIAEQMKVNCSVTLPDLDISQYLVGAYKVAEALITDNSIYGML